jgi:hypothetical protein
VDTPEPLAVQRRDAEPRYEVVFSQSYFSEVISDDSAAKAKVSALIEDHRRRRRGTGDQRELHQHLIR